MRVVIRADAASHIGTGHVMRCLALANALKEKGAEVYFVCRPFVGHLGEYIVAEGHQLHLLPPATQAVKPEPDPKQSPPHEAWRGESWEADLDQTQVVLGEQYFDWLIVDHYSLDNRWESPMRKFFRKIMVVDDLADRLHDCDLLLDQTFGRSEEAYKPRVPKNCIVLTGSNYALLRPEFAELRDHSLKRRTKPEIKHLLVSMGGIDQTNATG
jgi:UDP-2,4-diacetamido-2,4,6-trideoxy-beta-L-altropyranose hydrolase